MITKIALLTNAYPPRHTGGAARIAAKQAEILTNAGYEVRVWSPEVAWFGLPAWKRLWCHLQDLGQNKSLVKDISAWKPDILLTHNLTGCGFGTPAAIQKTGVRWVHVLHDIQLFEPSGQLTCLKPVTFWQVFWAFARLLAFKRPHLVLSPTRWLLEQHRYRYMLKYNEIHSEVLPNPAPPLTQVARMGVHNPIRLLFVGQVSRAKGSELLCRLAQTLRIPFELHVVGEGPAFEELRAASPQVICHGVCDTPQVLAHMEEADILLIPSSIHENQPTVILEAASKLLPVIASNRGGIVETLEMAAANMICPPGNVESWCKIIENLTDPGVYQHQVHLMRHIAEAHDPQVYAQRFLSLLIPKR